MKLSFFLGYLKDPQMQEALKKVSPYEYALFLTGDNYLKEFTFQGKNYLGKFAPDFMTLEELEIFEAHVKSILQRIFPKISISGSSLELFALSDMSHEISKAESTAERVTVP